ncbi:MAG: FumA C-terminus/TtdB family hydratase beta subunit [Candidatus Omnitrophota bacterium]
MKRITVPLSQEDVIDLRSGDEVLLSGYIYTARDQAHKRFLEAIKKKKKLPIGLNKQVIYYCAPTQPPSGKAAGISSALSASGRRRSIRAVGSCGPTTSRRMDAFTIPLLKKGLKGMIGKGGRSANIRDAIKKYKAVYFLAPGGCGALISKYVESAQSIAYKDLGPERIMKLKVRDFPLIVGIDSKGRSFYG